DCAENSGAPSSNDFFDNEQDGGDRRVEGGSQACSRADRSDQTKSLSREFQFSAQERSETGADLERWILRSQRLPATDCKGAGDELPYHGIAGDVAVVDIERALSLVHSTAARAGKEADDEDCDEQADSARDQNDPRERRTERTSKQDQPGRFNRNAKANDCQPGKYANKNCKDEEELLLPGGQKFASKKTAEGSPVFSGDWCTFAPCLRLYHLSWFPSCERASAESRRGLSGLHRAQP